MNLAVIPTRLLLKEEFAEPFGAEIAGNAESIRTMRLSDTVRDPRVLSPVAVGVVHFQLRMRQLQTVQYLPAHNSHEGFRTERLPALGTQLDFSTMKRLMARLTKRNQVARRISAGTSAFQMMNIEHRVFRSAVTMLTNVAVSEKDILSDVPEGELFALLVLFPRNVRILRQLRVERRRLHGDLRDRQQSKNCFYARQVRVDSVFNRRCKPAFALGADAVVEPRCAVARFAVAARLP